MSSNCDPGVHLFRAGLTSCTRSAFLLLMALDAVKARNSLQIFGLCVFNFMFLVCCAFFLGLETENR